MVLDFIILDSVDGGIGVVFMLLIDDVGMLLWELLFILVDKLVEYGLCDCIWVICFGKLIIFSVVVIVICVGVDFVVFVWGFMFLLGCI